MYFITPTPEQIQSALKSWQWIGVSNKTPIRVTAFSDVFFKDESGIWFLDTVGGKLDQICSDEEELEKILKTEDGMNDFLFPDLVRQAKEEGKNLKDGQCYDFKLNPVLGGELEYENIEVTDFVVALNICGQIHDQVRSMPEGTKISEIKITDPNQPKPEEKKSTWKFWK